MIFGSTVRKYSKGNDTIPGVGVSGGFGVSETSVLCYCVDLSQRNDGKVNKINCQKNSTIKTCLKALKTESSEKDIAFLKFFSYLTQWIFKSIQNTYCSTDKSFAYTLGLYELETLKSKGSYIHLVFCSDLKKCLASQE